MIQKQTQAVERANPAALQSQEVLTIQKLASEILQKLPSQQQITSPGKEILKNATCVATQLQQLRHGGRTDGPLTGFCTVPSRNRVASQETATLAKKLTKFKGPKEIQPNPQQKAIQPAAAAPTSVPSRSRKRNSAEDIKPYHQRCAREIHHFIKVSPPLLPTMPPLSSTRHSAPHPSFPPHLY
jgi:hypothetical protein